MTITANQLLNLFTKVEKLGYSYSFHEDEDESGDYEIVINCGNEWAETVELYISIKSNRYDTFNYVMEQLDKELNAKVIDKEKEERFKMYQELQKEFGNN